MLDELHSPDGHRHRSTIAMTVAVVVLLAALVWQQSRGHPSGSDRPPSARGVIDDGKVAAGPTVSANRVISPCDVVQDCLGHDTYRLHLRAPVSFTLPAGWSSTSHDATDADFYSAVPGYGVSVLEDVLPAVRSSHSQVGHTGRTTTAESVTRWLADRPFLTAGGVTRTTLSGLPAWQVDVRLAPNQRTDAACSRHCAHTFVPLLLTDRLRLRTVGISGNERIRWIVLDLAGGGATAISVWDLTDRFDMLSPAQPLVDSIRFIEFR